MKSKIIASFITFILVLICLFIPNEVSAISSLGGYEIENYKIDMVVNENNTYDIKEVIDVNFTDTGKHGIFRKIPLKNSIKRIDGTTSSNVAKITNLKVNEPYKVSVEDKYKIIKIGSENKSVIGRKTYIISYTYNIGKDPLKSEDELYFNLIGSQWDAIIKNVKFNIIMPKNFDKTKLGFSSGSVGSIGSSNIEYQVNGNVISGYTTGPLGIYNAITIRLILPEGYFVGASTNFDFFFYIYNCFLYNMCAYII